MTRARATKTSKPSKKPTPKSGELPPFPFVGAGEAQYFELADLYVRFRSAPTAREREKIVSGIPRPIGDVKWNDAVLYASSEQAVGRQISAAYGPKLKVPSELQSSHRFRAAGTDEVARFNAHIETWLETIHSIRPILIAYRRQDWEAGGTRLSPWHTASLSSIAPSLEAMSESPCALDLDLGERLVAAAKEAKKRIAPGLFSALEKKCKPLVAAMDSADADDADDDEAAIISRYEAALAVPKTYDAAKLPLADEAALDEALRGLERTLPNLVKALRRIPTKNRRLRPGATKAAIDATEKAIGRNLTPAHRALLMAFDGGQAGELVFLGTPASGARGRDSLADFSRGLQIRGFDLNPVVRSVDKYGDSFVGTKKTGEGAQQISYLVEYTRSSSKLDNLLADAVKAGKLSGSWS